MSRLLRMGRGAWFGVGVVAGTMLAELLPWGAWHVIDMIQAVDFR